MTKAAKRDIVREGQGANYRATARISAIDDHTLADVGETCERVPDVSLGWLEEQGYIVPVDPESEE